MDANKKYITQLSAKDLREIAQAANVYAGEGLIVTHNDDGICIKVDTSMLQMWIRHVIAGYNIG